MRFFLSAGDSGRGAMNITTKVTFDREKDGKRLELPIYVRDSGKPPMEAIRYFPVIIGDENDNPMTDGRSEIQVYSYNSKFKFHFLRFNLSIFLFRQNASNVNRSSLRGRFGRLGYRGQDVRMEERSAERFPARF